jgi:hypothetical protein
MRIRQFKILHLILVTAIALAMQACVFNIGFVAASQLFAHEHHGRHGQANHDDEKQAPSHSHDNEGHEADFCCDNSFTLSKTPCFFNRIAKANTPSTSLEVFEKSRVPSFTQIHPHSTFLTSSISGPRDKYALSCLLHAPPRA